MIEKITRDFIMIWTTVNPIDTLALFAGLTASLTRKERRWIAFRASVYSTIILVVAVVLGQIILDAMGIRLLSLQVAGGIILFLFGLQMLFGTAGHSTDSPEKGHDLAVFPLAVPAIVGARCNHGGDSVDRQRCLFSSPASGDSSGVNCRSGT